MAAKLLLFSLLVLLSFILSSSSSSNVEDERKSRWFIRARCNAVSSHKYLCCNSLSPHAPTIQLNPFALARTAVNVTFERLRSLPARISKLSSNSTGAEKQLLDSCHLYVDDALWRLKKAADCIRGLEATAAGQERATHLVVARSSLAQGIEDEVRCLDDVNGAGVGVRSEVRSEVNRLVGPSRRYMDNANDLVAALA